jgi:hypothetical protein
VISVPTASPSRATLWATDAISELLEDLQFTLDEGPAWRLRPLAARRPLVASVHHGSDTARWPIFAAAVAD